MKVFIIFEFLRGLSHYFTLFLCHLSYPPQNDLILLNSTFLWECYQYVFQLSLWFLLYWHQHFLIAVGDAQFCEKSLFHLKHFIHSHLFDQRQARIRWCYEMLTQDVSGIIRYVSALHRFLKYFFQDFFEMITSHIFISFFLGPLLQERFIVHKHQYFFLNQQTSLKYLNPLIMPLDLLFFWHQLNLVFPIFYCQIRVKKFQVTYIQILPCSPFLPFYYFHFLHFILFFLYFHHSVHLE